ncbi:sorting nexin-20 isoform X2 [Amia ocellicauda]|uniref:sorting nexin-20 isoform X2 n=1 Tax=Amia ocellicauda TaxID=2972642 RepID=UPI003464E8A9
MGDSCDPEQSVPSLAEDNGGSQSDSRTQQQLPQACAPAQQHYEHCTDLDDCSAGPSSTMTTKQLQEYWREMKSHRKPVKLLFEIPTARIVELPLCRYVMYQVVVIKSGSYDAKQVSIERRYSDFERLHQELLQDFSEELEEVTFPRKKVTGNFAPEIITERRAAFKDYLARLSFLNCVRRSPAFLAFFTHDELRLAHSCLRGGQYARALQVLLPVLDLQEKLVQHSPVLLVPTLCAVLVCHRDLDDSASAFSMGERALALTRRVHRHLYRAPLLATLIDLGYELGRPIAVLQEELQRLQDSLRGRVSQLSLKELVVQEFT